MLRLQKFARTASVCLNKPLSINVKSVQLQTPVVMNQINVNTVFTSTKTKLNVFKTENYVSAEAQDAKLPPLGSTLTLTDSNDDWELAYDGVIGNALRQLKMLSLSSLCLSVLSAPIIATFETTAVSETGKLLLAAITVSMGVGTTFMTNIVCAPYIARAFVSRTNPNVIEITTVGFTGKYQAFRFNVNEPTSTHTTRPLTTFQHLATGKHFYLHEDRATHPVFAPILPHLFEEVKEE